MSHVLDGEVGAAVPLLQHGHDGGGGGAARDTLHPAQLEVADPGAAFPVGLGQGDEVLQAGVGGRHADREQLVVRVTVGDPHLAGVDGLARHDVGPRLRAHHDRVTE